MDTLLVAVVSVCSWPVEAFQGKDILHAVVAARDSQHAVILRECLLHAAVV